MSQRSVLAEVVADPGFPALKSHVVELTGLSYFNSREADLAARLRRRLAATAQPDCGSYLELLRDPQGQERDPLIHELTIGETHFFRFAEQFEALRSIVIPALLEKNRDRRKLRIWSAGCSIGAEVYSLAILLEREFDTRLQGWSVSLAGSDIDLEFLERARAGHFAEWALRGVSEALRRECFTETASGWQLDRRFIRHTTFIQHNLVQDPLPPPEIGGDLDLVLCRNVMIYFDEATIRRVVTSLHRSLSREGWLLVGHAEGNSEVFHSFQAHHTEGAILFQNSPLRVPQSRPFPVPAAASRVLERPLESEPRAPVEQLLTWKPYQLDEPPAGSPCVAAATPPSGGADRLAEVRTLADQGAWSAANERLQSVLEAEPLNPQSHFYQGLILAQSDRPAEAETAFRRALFLDPKQPLAYYHLGLLLLARGAQAEALRAFRNTLRAVENTADDAPLPGSDLTVSRLRAAALLQINGVKP